MSRLTGPLLGFGVFVMMRRQMLGLKERAERLIQPAVEPEGERSAAPIDTPGVAPAEA
jgi:hypothetical protein